ncbi:hypothetical protein DPEC_G00192510 [Dallia pectoralis]|uniref:Uncharacterized protein n=1 Tax=Dallia pectoralis TaxID=75939 RepID=A0ACC2GCF1_DALPE|nr:hypothetical protein DPEC_G00192510 [Dallia pectoralis]
MEASPAAVFIEDPSDEGLLALLKTDLLAVADFYKIPIQKQALKATIVEAIREHLVDQGILTLKEEGEAQDGVGSEGALMSLSPVRSKDGVMGEPQTPVTLPKYDPSSPLSSSSMKATRLRLRVTRLEAELKDKEERRKYEFELEYRRLQADTEIRKKEIDTAADKEARISIRCLELEAGASPPPAEQQNLFDGSYGIAMA